MSAFQSNTAVGISWVIAALAGIVAIWGHFTDPLPKTWEEANSQLERISEGIERLSPGDAQASTVQEIARNSVQIASSSVRNFDEATATMFLVSEGVFDLSTNSTVDLMLPSGRTAPINLYYLHTGDTKVRFRMNGKEVTFDVGDIYSFFDGEDKCRILFVRRNSRDSVRFRFRCSGF